MFLSRLIFCSVILSPIISDQYRLQFLIVYDMIQKNVARDNGQFKLFFDGEIYILAYI